MAALIHSKLLAVPLEEAMAVIRAAHPDSKIKASLWPGNLSSNTPKKISRIAISGGQGFVGTRLTRHLSQAGFQCLPLTRSQHGDYLSSSQNLKNALSDFIPHLFIHLAHPKPYNSEKTSQIALSQVISVSSYCEDHGICLVYPSSWAVFDGLSIGNEVSRASKVCPHTRYGRLKAMSEQYLAVAPTEGLKVRILRLPGIFGEDSLEPRFLRYFAECVRSGSEIVYHQFENGSARVPLLHVDACVEAIADAVARFDDLALITHIGGEERSPSVAEIAARVSRETGVSTKSTPVARSAFVGFFSPDIKVSRKKSADIHQFLLQLCRVQDAG
ncbi:MAG: NAD(P)-dependent oxidoreductase [Planctomycetaceae bacterium]